MYGATAVLPISPETALQRVIEAMNDTLSSIVHYPELTSFLTRWEEISPIVADSLDQTDVERLILLSEIAEQSAGLAEVIMSEKIGHSDDDGFRMRLKVKRLIDELATCAPRIEQFVRDNSEREMRTTGILFEYNWKRLGQRLIDEHSKRNIADGDELS